LVQKKGSSLWMFLVSKNLFCPARNLTLHCTSGTGGSSLILFKYFIYLLSPLASQTKRLLLQGAQ
jgi:hypothetical protein